MMYKRCLKIGCEYKNVFHIQQFLSIIFSQNLELFFEGLKFCLNFEANTNLESNSKVSILQKATWLNNRWSLAMHHVNTKNHYHITVRYCSKMPSWIPPLFLKLYFGIHEIKATIKLDDIAVLYRSLVYRLMINIYVLILLESQVYRLYNFLCLDHVMYNAMTWLLKG